MCIRDSAGTDSDVRRRTRVCRRGACSLSAGTGPAARLPARGLQLACQHGACSLPADPAGGVPVMAV
eukprot:7892689-Alexandrium_andersonii.AAC.1